MRLPLPGPWPVLLPLSALRLRGAVPALPRPLAADLPPALLLLPPSLLLLPFLQPFMGTSCKVLGASMPLAACRQCAKPGKRSSKVEEAMLWKEMPLALASACKWSQRWSQGGSRL